MKYAIGIDLGATHTRIAVVDEKGNFLSRSSEITEKTQGPKGIINQMTKMIRSLLQKHEGVVGIGIGVASPVNLKEGSMVNPANFPYKVIPLVEPIKREFKLPTHLHNDCNAAVLGEKKFGAGKNLENLVYVTLSTGIGGGIYINDKLLLGKDGSAGEIGHFIIDFKGKLKCSCGKRGHWEAYCSGENIPNFVRLLMKENKNLAMRFKNKEITAKMICDLAKEGDKLASEVVDRIGRLNAIGVANVINAYDPSLITIGGSIALNNKKLVVEPIRRYVGDYTINRVPKIMITPLGEDTVLYGAVATVFYPNF